MTETPTITIDLDKKCAECGKRGATRNQLCVRCTTNAITDRPMKSWQGKAVQKRAQAFRL